MKISSYDEIVKSNKDEKEKGNSSSKTAKAKVQSKLQQLVSEAEVKNIEAEENFEKSVLSGDGIDVAALNMRKAAETLTFYNGLYKGLFPNASSAPTS